MDEEGKALSIALKRRVWSVVDDFFRARQLMPRYTVTRGEPHTRKFDYRVMCVVVDVEPEVADEITALMKQHAFMLLPDQEKERRTPVIVESTLHSIKLAVM